MYSSFRELPDSSLGSKFHQRSTRASLDVYDSKLLHPTLTRQQSPSCRLRSRLSRSLARKFAVGAEECKSVKKAAILTWSTRRRFMALRMGTSEYGGTFYTQGVAITEL